MNEPRPTVLADVLYWPLVALLAAAEWVASHRVRALSWLERRRRFAYTGGSVAMRLGPGGLVLGPKAKERVTTAQALVDRHRTGSSVKRWAPGLWWFGPAGAPVEPQDEQ